MVENQVMQQRHLPPNNKAPSQEYTSKLEPERLPHPLRGSSRRRSCAGTRQKTKWCIQTPPTQQQGSTAGVDQRTGERKGAEPAKGKQRKGKLRWHKVENQVLYQDTANPTINVHCRSRPANLSQLGAEPEKGSQLQDTQRKTAGASGKGTAATPKEVQQEPTPYPAGGEEEDTAPPPQKETPYTHRDHQRWGPAAKTQKASYCRIERSGEETDGAKKGYTISGAKE